MTDHAQRAFRVACCLGQLCSDWTPLPDLAEAVATHADVDADVAALAVAAWTLAGPVDRRQSVGPGCESLWLIRARP